MKTAILLVLGTVLAARGAVHHGRTHNHHWDMDIVTAHEEQFTPAPHQHDIHKDNCKGKAVCVLPVQCPAHFYGSQVYCEALGGRKGVCCSTGHNHTEKHVATKGRGHHGLISHIDPDVLGSVARHSRVEIAELHLREAKLFSSGKAPNIPLGSASYGHFRNARVFGPGDLSDVMGVANRALEIALATRAFKQRQGLTNQQLEWGMVQQNLRPTPLGRACGPIIHCPAVPEQFRRIDGTCNNLFNPSWGAALTPFARLLPPSYQDGIWSPRVSELDGLSLPSPRKISTTLFPDIDNVNKMYTLMLVQFGQFLSHEITHSIDTTFTNGTSIACCLRDGSDVIPDEIRHFACMPIEIPKDDEFYSMFKQGCMNFVRSVMAPRSDCTLGYAQQMNKVTHFLDGSAIYGSTPAKTAELRSFHGGKLRAHTDYSRQLLPLAKQPDACITMEQGSACFESGDSRTNQMITLVAVHTVFFREHNRLAVELEKLNPHWTDERIFLEARRILTAELQVITYKQYLPALLGEKTMHEFDIAHKHGADYSYDYNQRVEPSVTNEFSGAAFRMGHSMVDGLLKIYGTDRMDEMISIPEVMFYPARMRKHQFLDQILSSLTTEPIQQVDNFVSETLTKYLFRAGNPFGIDLVSLNIQRGRDHGLRPYNDYRQLVGLPRYKSFADFGPQLGPKLASVYSHVDDVDLWVGGLLEAKHDGGLLGLTFRDIIADQFVRLRKGDKYFYDHDPTVNPSHFTPHQLAEVRKSSMARLVCDNSDGYLLERQAPNAFKSPEEHGNEIVDCISERIPRIDLRHWQELF